jgi:hypothetical protein
VKKAIKLTTKAAQQGLAIEKFKQYTVVTTDGKGQQVATQAELEAMRDELRAGMEQVKNDLLGQQIKSAGYEHMDAMERFALQTAQMVARENGAVAERVEQCIDMVAQGAIMPGHEAYQEQGPREFLPNSPTLDVLAADRAKNGACIFQVATFVEERAVVFLLHSAWAIWKRHTSYCACVGSNDVRNA